MALVAPDTNPDVTPTPVRRQGSIWTALGSLLGLIAALLPALPLPDAARPWIPFIGAILGWAAHQIAGPDEYRPAPPQV